MARAFLNVVDSQHGARLVLEAEVPTPGPFRGPATRDWANVQVTPLGIAFEWRTAADRVAELARAVKRGTLAWQDALEDDTFSDQVESMRELLAKDHEDDSDDTVLDLLCDADSDPSVVSSLYVEDGDLHLAAAARVLPLPPWARWAIDDEGGAGAGYGQHVIVLDRPHRADELVAYWRALEATAEDAAQHASPFTRVSALERAYRQTDYVVDDGEVRFTLRIDEASSEADAWLLRWNVVTWAFLTAENPGSRPLSAQENASRRAQLRERLDAMPGLHVCEGEGRGRDGAWAPEKSVWVAGLSFETARDLARDFGQVAFVFGVLGEPARLYVRQISSAPS